MNVVTSLLETAGQAAASFGTVLAQAAAAVGSIFWDANNGLTLIGTLGVIGLGIGAVYMMFRLIRRLMRAR